MPDLSEIVDLKKNLLLNGGKLYADIMDFGLVLSKKSGDELLTDAGSMAGAFSATLFETLNSPDSLNYSYNWKRIIDCDPVVDSIEDCPV